MKDIVSLVDRLMYRYGLGAGGMYYEDYSVRLKDKKYSGNPEKGYLAYSTHKYNHLKRWLRLYHRIDVDKPVSHIFVAIRRYDRERD